MNNGVLLQDIDVKQRQKNKKRLISQNRKLNEQIRSIQKDIEELLRVKQPEPADPTEKPSQQLNQLRQQLSMQEKYMKKLRGKISTLKSSNAKGNAQFIIKQQDELTSLKRQYASLVVEKSTISKFKDDKLRVLDNDKPFQAHKKQMEDSLAEVRKSNRTMQAEVTSIQREVRKYHNYLVLSSTLRADKKDNSEMQFQIAKNEHEIKGWIAKSRDLEEKWRVQFEGLDAELFQLKSRHAKTQSRLKETERQHRTWQIRKNGLRDEEQIIGTRERLSKLPISPQKTSNMQQQQAKTVAKKLKISTSLLIKKSRSKDKNESQHNADNKTERLVQKKSLFQSPPKTQKIILKSIQKVKEGERSKNDKNMLDEFIKKSPKIQKKSDSRYQKQTNDADQKITPVKQVEQKPKGIDSSNRKIKEAQTQKKNENKNKTQSLTVKEATQRKQQPVRSPQGKNQKLNRSAEKTKQRPKQKPEQKLTQKSSKQNLVGRQRPGVEKQGNQSKPTKEPQQKNRKHEDNTGAAKFSPRRKGEPQQRKPAKLLLKNVGVGTQQ